MKKFLCGTLVLALAPFVFAAQQNPTTGGSQSTQETQKPVKKKKSRKHKQDQTQDQTQTQAQQQSGQTTTHGHKGGRNK